MIGILFCLASFLLGTSIALYFPGFERTEEKLTLGLILGFTLTTWATFILSLILKSLSIPLILGVTLISALFSLVLLKRYPKTKPPLIIKPSKTYLIIFVLFTILLSLVNFNTIKFDTQGNLRAMQTAWGDYAMHLSYIMHFTEKLPLTLNHPLIVNHKLAYPFLIDFLSAIIYKGGLNYVTSIVLINIIFSVALISIILIFTKEFTGSELAGLFVLMLFFLNGNSGFLFALGKGLKELILPGSFYTKIDPRGLVWGNTLSVLFLSQRAFIWGMAVSVFIYYIFLKEFFIKEGLASSQNLALSGLLLGTLPLIHTPSLLSAGFASLFFFLFRMRKEWIYFIIPAGLVALPQISYLMGRHILAKSFWLQPGWMFKTANPFLIMLFWVYNLGIISFLIIAGLFLTEKKKSLFYLPFFVIFILANFIIVHPSDWDNAKYFLHWFFLSCVMASFVLINILNNTSRWKKPDRIFMFAVLIFLSIFSGLLDYIYLNRVSFVLADKKAQEVARWVRRNIPPSSLILTSDAHNHPVSMLGGKNIVLGYKGWLWSHGYDYGEIEEDVQKIYQTADLRLIKKYKITHIVISSYEKNLKPNLRAFLNSKNFKEIYQAKTDAGIFRIFEVDTNYPE